MSSIVSFRDEYTVRKMNSKQGKEFIKEHHYSKGCHNGPMCYGMFDSSDVLVGVCAFATPCSENVRRSVFGEEMKSTVTELHRLVLLDEIPPNAESWFIAKALKLLKQDKPEYRAVLSFADATEGHVGTIYQATNALFCGTSGKATFYFDVTGRLRHPRQNGVNISKQEALNRGWIAVKRDGKYRYLFLLPNSKWDRKNLLRRLKLTVQPYPKSVV